MMLNSEEHPVSWELWMYELTEAKEHLGALIDDIINSRVDEEDFAVQLGHVFAHLNRAWNGRNDNEIEGWSQETHVEMSHFPNDLYPVG